MLSTHSWDSSSTSVNVQCIEAVGLIATTRTSDGIPCAPREACVSSYHNWPSRHLWESAAVECSVNSMAASSPIRSIKQGCSRLLREGPYLLNLNYAFFNLPLGTWPSVSSFHSYCSALTISLRHDHPLRVSWTVPGIHASEGKYGIRGPSRAICCIWHGDATYGTIPTFYDNLFLSVGTQVASSLCLKSQGYVILIVVVTRLSLESYSAIAYSSFVQT